LLGRRSNKTVRRSARGLKALELVNIRRGVREKSGCRYAPVLLPEDWDKFGNGSRQKRSTRSDTDVHQSSLSIQLESSSMASRKAKEGISTGTPFNPATRGAIELKLAAMFAPNGLDVLGRLASIDDAIISRLCRAFVEGLIGAAITSRSRKETSNK